MSKITKSAAGKQCTARIPGVCNGNPHTTIWAHIRKVRYGAGTGQKPSDLIGLYACSACHDVIDGRIKTNHEKDFVEMCMYEGHCESLKILVEDGVI